MISNIWMATSWSSKYFRPLQKALSLPSFDWHSVDLILTIVSNDYEDFFYYD